MSVSSEKGASILEFAVILPLVSTLIFGIVQYGLIFGAYSTLKDASTFGARFATLGDTARSRDDVRTAASSAVAPVLDPTRVDTSGVVKDVVVGGVGGAWKIELSYPFPVYFPVPGSSNGTFVIRTSTVMR